MQWLLAALIAGAGAGPLVGRVAPERCLPQAGDYAFMWWADGFRGRSPEGWLRCVQTGRYAMAMDVERMRIPHLGSVAHPLPYGEAVSQENAVVTALPPADLELLLTAGGKEYRCVAGGKPGQHDGPRIIESGRFLQRADVTNLVFQDADGNRLAADARLETIAWPDRLTLLLEASPARQDLRAGPSFGRVGGGYCFDGTNHLEFPNAPELEPEALTLSLWVYVPDGPQATRAQPWLVCKNGNEWAEGNYGFMLIDGAPTAFLNIGGGRENMHTLSTRAGLSREQWHHLAMTYDGAAFRLFVDGKERASEQVGKRRVPGAGGLALGRRQDNSGDGYHFRGVLDEVRLYRRALSAEEIAAQAAAPEAVKPDPSLAREWVFDPNGPAAAQRPGAQWANPSMEIRLRAGGRVLSDRYALRFADAASANMAGEEWRQGQRRAVSISLLPGAPAAPSAPDLIITASALPAGGACPVAYDARRDWYRVGLDGVLPEGEGNDAIERVKVTLANPDGQERTARLLFDKTGAGMRIKGIAAPTGLSPMLRDPDGMPSGIPVQISKNWHSQPGRDLLYQGAWLHGLTMLRLPPRSALELEFTLAYAHWGGLPAASHAQLCLIGWGSNQLWEESALGCWGESICYEPDQAQAEAAVLDVRPLMVHRMNSDEPGEWGWTNNVGGADFFRYFDAEGSRQFPARMRTAYRRYGPVLTEVTHAGRSQDGKIEHRETVSLYRSDDLVRGIYRIRMDVKQAADFRRFVIFQAGADTYSYTGERKMAIGNERGLTREWETRWGGDTYRTESLECAGRVPWLSLHDAVSRDRSKAGAWANRGIIIREWSARLGGKPAAPWAAEHGDNARGEPTSTMDILPPPDVHRLLPGDYVDATIEHVIVPQFARDYYGPNRNLRAALEKNENTWGMVLREARDNSLGVRASEGVVESSWPVRVRAAGGDHAALTLEGGLGYVPVTFAGLSGYRRPILEVREGAGPWRPVDQSVHGRDFWQTDYDSASGTYEITYSIPCDTPGDARATRELRFRVEGNR